jgi:hypothetical protein
MNVKTFPVGFVELSAANMATGVNGLSVKVWKVIPELPVGVQGRKQFSN